MRSIRRHLFSAALATVGVQALVIALGVARVCWGAEHAHHGADAVDCPHHGDAQPSHAHHAQHADLTGAVLQDHHNVSNVANDDAKGARAQLTCGCSNNVIAVYIGPAGIVPSPAFLPASTQVVMLARAGNASPADVWFPPLSPPPRTRFSHVS